MHSLQLVLVLMFEARDDAYMVFFHHVLSWVPTRACTRDVAKVEKLALGGASRPPTFPKLSIASVFVAR